MKKTKKIILTSFGIVAVLAVSLAFIKPFQQSAAWVAPATAKSLKNPVVPDATNLAEAKKVYVKNCNSCHGKKGDGDGPSAATVGKVIAPLNDAKTQAQADGELFWKITEGKKPMPTTKKSLTDQQRWLVVNYIRTFSATAK